MEIINIPKLFHLSTELSTEKTAQIQFFRWTNPKIVDNLVDKVENFIGYLSLHNYIFLSNFFIMSGPCSTKIFVDLAEASVKLETPAFEAVLSYNKYGTGSDECVIISSGVGWSGIMRIR